MEKAQGPLRILDLRSRFGMQHVFCAEIWTHLNIKALYWIEFGSTTYIIIDYEK